MLERLKDRVADIRSQAVTALMRLQDPKDENCPIIKVKFHCLCFLYLIEFISNVSLQV